MRGHRVILEEANQVFLDEEHGDDRDAGYRRVRLVDRAAGQVSRDLLRQMIA